ncbi:Beta-hexosaminidase (N-acetyl-beta-glucosaminidase) (Beta-N-acetylhexosaminidase) [Candidatus Glomeribacter gigasporarum BEG34]|uniref:Beta-hexosaminidase n=1 Tax=Candidatus Glomeribacter gigasporarum BEG34 TaxID=1070319 RepID=G2J900_9BURK|nr:beta-N-acetylhexosaminidase [Candidatus Glomeribacter gigasporarum]CCD29247.1 Beta-hexosaminidase (N-acetyl-beta-glucosaminidase) (Beta-N-acetylhexosaminidase) [Candidatus Glomeribacter gigasporarum BEG34]
MKTARRPLGPVMIDLSGCELSRDEQRWLTHPNMGGVILFARNFRDRAQLAALTVQIRSIRHDALIAVDHEGGRVQRFRSDGFTHLPAMRRLGECWDDDAPLAACAATAAGYILASELRASGIDFSFTPVLDLDYGRSTAIGDRAFHANPAIVAALAKHLCHGLALAGMANCGKHFPGHGFVEADSHHAMPVDARALDTLLHDAQPYVWVDLALVAVMPAHVVYSAVDAWPAGFSKIWLRDILRRRLGFSGAILSDDLSMEGARAMGDIVESAQAVLDAGCDMALVCNCPDQTQQVLDRVRHAPSSDSSARLRSLAARGAALSWDALTRQPRYQAARALLNRL